MYTTDRSLLHGGHLHASQGRQAASSSVHSVHFYEDDTLFLDGLSEFVGAALGAGGACVVIATDAHRAGLADRLKSHGIDVAFAIAMNRLISLDASEVLSGFMVDGYPDELRFNETIEPELTRARKALHRHSTSVVAFGEMVSVLWEQGKYDAAIELERLWDLLVDRHGFSLRCAYPMGLFTDPAQYELFQQVCTAHAQVVPGESYTALANENDRHRMISSLQQKAWTVEAVMKGREEEAARLKHAEVRLRRSEEFARSVLECSVDCVKVLDLDGRVEYVSPAGIRALQMEDSSRLLGRPWVEFWKPEDRPRAEAALAAAVAHGVGSFTGEAATRGGNLKAWDVRITPVLDAEGRVERLIAVSRDISELRSAQQAAIEAERQATAGRLAASVAHEINNPLEAVTNFIFLAMSVEGLPEEAAGHLRIADRELVRAAQITRQMLGFYRGGSRPKWVPVAELIEDVLMLCDRKLRGKHLSASVSAAPELQVYGKDGELRQILLNLTANAVDASEPGAKLWFRARRMRSWKGHARDGVRITVADRGSGMSPEVRRRIFEPFFTTKSERGTGIGLWVAKCLVEQQGGHIQCRSRQGEWSGTVMSLFLPVAFDESKEELAEVA